MFEQNFSLTNCFSALALYLMDEISYDTAYETIRYEDTNNRVLRTLENCYCDLTMLDNDGANISRMAMLARITADDRLNIDLNLKARILKYIDKVYKTTKLNTLVS